MNILFIIGSCLRTNTSANLCHIAYIRGFIESGHDVDVISVGEKNCAVDETILLPKANNYYYFDVPKNESYSKNTVNQESKDTTKLYIKVLKYIARSMYAPYGRTATIWARRASRFYSDKKYDYVISLATPYVSHYAAELLINKHKINFGKWIQIWEDPWQQDLYNRNNKSISKEEHRLLYHANKIIYVSPLTLKYQSEIFNDCAYKMEWMTLPSYYEMDDKKIDYSNLQFGYYGDYFSFSRNMKPFYLAAKELNIRLNIYGNSDILLESTATIKIKPRVKLQQLKYAEDNTDVLVFLCNIHGGQIPGKLYQYSASNRIILFILDGTDEEINTIHHYYSKFNRYYFCENNIKSIKEAIKTICNGNSTVRNCKLTEFSPKHTAEKLIDIFNNSNGILNN